MNLTLTPRTIAIGHLVNLYATDEDLSLGIRQHLAIMLIELVSGSGAGVPTSAVEPGLRELSDAVASLGSRVVQQIGRWFGPWRRPRRLALRPKR